MSITKTLAGAMPFAHLLSNGKRAARAEQDERDQRDDESDEDYAKRMEDLDEKDRAEEEKEKEDARKAAEEKEKEEARRAGAEGDDGDDESDDAKKAARATERTRCARIIAHGINIGAAAQAGVFAFDTKMSSKPRSRRSTRQTRPADRAVPRWTTACRAPRRRTPAPAA